ncbi:MAG: metallopeptidase family protein, partial [Myxococcales bacterium]|nr:metallopeptidase family protein [Myxococcales bacterium]
RPHWDVVADGFDPRALGMFEGPDDFGQRILELAPMTSRIVLFTANLVASFADPEDLEEEVRVTVLHEVGHYFGLDEDGVAALGLE